MQEVVFWSKGNIIFSFLQISQQKPFSQKKKKKKSNYNNIKVKSERGGRKNAHVFSQKSTNSCRFYLGLAQYAFVLDVVLALCDERAQRAKQRAIAQIDQVLMMGDLFVHLCQFMLIYACVCMR